MTKVWNGDDNNSLGLRNGSVGYTIYQDGSAFKTGTLSDVNGWSQSVKVPKYSDIDHTVPYVYSVTEDTNNKYYTTDVTSDNGEDFIITNTFIPREQITITVKKAWENDEKHKELRSDSVEYSISWNNRLYHMGELKGPQWTDTFEAPKYFDIDQTKLNTYNVTEFIQNPNYTSKVTAEEDAGGNKTFTITNTFDPTQITITKHWDDAGNEDKRDDVNVTLLQDGEEYGKYTITGSNESDTWSYPIDDIPKYAKDGHRYSYTVSEEKINDYTLVSDLLVNPEIGNNYQASITNKYSPNIDLTETVTVSVTKHWSDKGHEENRKAVEFKLVRNDGFEYGPYIIPNAGITDDNWHYDINESLPKYDADGNLYTYNIVETKVEGYTSNVTQDPAEENGYKAVISNQYIPPETIDISVTKSWDDDGYKYKRGDVTLNLMRNGEKCDSYTISAEDNIGNDVWKYTFRSVPKNDVNKNAYTYTVEEEVMEGYTSAVTAGVGNSWSITNKYNVPAEPDDPKPDDPKPDDPKPDDPKPDDPKPDDPKPDDPKPDDPKPDDPAPGTDPTPGTEPVPGTRPVYPPSGTSPIPVFSAAKDPKEPDRQEDPEDVSAEAGFFDEEFDAVRRDDMMILILVGIIITGTLILAVRHNSDKSDGKYHM